MTTSEMGSAPEAEWSLGQRDGWARRDCLVQKVVGRAEHRARDEAGERDDDRALPAADREERAGRARAAKLHAYAEKKRADHQSDAQRPGRRRRRGAEQAESRADDQREQGGGGAEEQGVRTQPRAVADGDELAPRGGEAEAGVEQRHAQADAEREQQDAELGAMARPDVPGQAAGERRPRRPAATTRTRLLRAAGRARRRRWGTRGTSFRRQGIRSSPPVLQAWGAEQDEQR